MMKRVCVYVFENRTRRLRQFGMSNDLIRRERDHVQGRVRATRAWRWTADRIRGEVVSCFPDTRSGRTQARLFMRSLTEEDTRSKPSLNTPQWPRRMSRRMA